MEEDIKILEEEIEWVKKEGVEVCGWEKVLPALENLLTRYKLLEEENKKMEELIENAECDMSTNFIRKSKVKEKIEELNNEEDTKYILSKTNRIIYKIDIIDILQELLEEEK